MFSLSKIFVTLFYVGYSKIIPGTVGSFFSFLILFIVHIFLDKYYLYLIFITLFVLSLYLIKADPCILFLGKLTSFTAPK